MKLRYLAIALMCLIGNALHAQGLLKGTVTESGSGAKLSDVFIRDANSKEVALTDKSGRFQIRTVSGHLLIFTAPGYLPDTLYLTDLNPKKVQLRVQNITLRAVNITSTSGFNPREEYPEIYRKSSFALSPSRMFGKEAKNARRLKRYFEREVTERQIDSLFSRTLVSSVVPLKGADLDNFMSVYRPTLPFLKRSSPQTLTLYINDSYKKFMAMPADKRGLQPLGN
jgi:hypothetical protein